MLTVFEQERNQHMQYTVTLTNGQEVNIIANPSIKEGVLMLISLTDKSLIASYAPGYWKSIVKSEVTK